MLWRYNVPQSKFSYNNSPRSKAIKYYYSHVTLANLQRQKLLQYDSQMSHKTANC